MRRTLIAVLLMAVLVVGIGGCTNLPTGVKSSLYTSQITLDQTVKEAVAEKRDPWAIPADATLEQKLAAREKQVILLVKTMEQANKNLKEVVEYVRSDDPWKMWRIK